MRIGVIRHFYESHLPAEDEMRRAFEAALRTYRNSRSARDVKLRELKSTTTVK